MMNDDDRFLQAALIGLVGLVVAAGLWKLVELLITIAESISELVR